MTYPHRRSEVSGPQFSNCRCGNCVVCWPDVTAVPPLKWGANCPAAMREEIANLAASLAEAEATLANERGEGEPPCEGWHYSIGRAAWVCQPWILTPRREGPELAVRRGDPWRVWVDGVCVYGQHPTARAAMRAASERLRGSP